MSFVLPNPTVPTNGTPGDATPILQNELALAQAIAGFDGSQINPSTVSEAALADAINPRLRGLETLLNFVYSGCTWNVITGLIGTMTGGTIYVNGYRTIVAGVGSNTFTASSDTYVDIDFLGNVTYHAVGNSAPAPSPTANAIRVAKIVTSGSAITSTTQNGIDSNNVPVYPTNPSIPGAWRSWTPTYANLVPGNGVVSAKYVQMGKTVHGKYIITFGTTSIMGTNPTISMPVTPTGDLIIEQFIGNATYIHTGLSIWAGAGVLAAGNNILFRTIANLSSVSNISMQSGQNLTNVSPFSWSPNDSLTLSFTYEAI